MILSRQHVRLRPITFISIDPGATNTGLAEFSFQWKERTLTYSLNWLSLFSPSKIHDTTPKKAEYLAGAIEAIFQQRQPDFFLIEMPPQTVYDPKGQGGRNQAVSRAQSIFTLFGMVYAIIGRVGQQVPYATILPSQWQTHRSKRNGLDSKDFSVEVANRIIDDLFEMGAATQQVRAMWPLATSAEENIADAINIGAMSLKKMAETYEFPVEISSELIRRRPDTLSVQVDS